MKRFRPNAHLRMQIIGQIPTSTCNRHALRLPLSRSNENAIKSPLLNPAISSNFTGFELLFFGTGAGSPSSKRNPTALCLRLDGTNWMFDCGEGALKRIMASIISVHKIDTFFFTHLHGDHIYGFPGILCTLDSCQVNSIAANPNVYNQKKKIQVYGPLGLYHYINTTMQIASTKLSYLDITVYELVTKEQVENMNNYERYADKAPRHRSIKRKYIYPQENSLTKYPIWNVKDDGKISVVASTLSHGITCFGYVVEEHPTPGHLDVDAVKARGLQPGPLYKRLKSGLDVHLPSGEIVHASEVMGPIIRGRKVAILGDSCDSSNMFDLAQNSDVLVHEATLSHTKEECQKALNRGHSTAKMAGYAAHKMNAKVLALTHFSHRFGFQTENLEKEAQETFKRRSIISAYDYLRIPVPKPSPHTVITSKE